MTGSSTASVADSHITRASLRTLDKERIRQKALFLNMKEKLRMSMCVRIQKVCKKPPAAAQTLATQVIEALQQQGASSNLTDAELQRLVGQFSRGQSSTASVSATEAKVMTPAREAKAETPKSSKSKARKASKQGSRTPSPAPLPAESIYVTESQLQQASVGFVLPPRKSPKKHKQDDIWNTLVQIQSLEEASEAQAKLQQKVKQKSTWSEELQAQVDDKLRRKDLEAQDNQKYFEESMHKLARMNDAERAKEIDRVARAKEQNRIQEEQRQYKLQKKLAEETARRQAEARMAETIAKQKADDEAKEAARKQAEKIKMARVLEENDAQLRKKQLMVAADRELEMKLASDYVAMEERKDAQRQKGLEELSKKIQAKMKFFDDTSKAETDIRNKEDEMRIRRYQEEYERRQAEIDDKKREEAMRRNHEQQAYLKQQMQLKKERERLEKEDYDKQADMWRVDRERAEQRQRLLDQQRATKNQLQQSWLQQQIRAKEEKDLEADHTPLEVQLNQTLLHKLGKLPAVATATRQRSRELSDRERVADAKRAPPKKDPRLKPASCKS
ncbi:trichohyalin-like protein [Achlya hypogyna]|uniref:Trichohyalin-like protein n=1 Tax=Achlya hypogyna TaxID=1202772 RepID=A0A1V9YEF1_ACHHY|nr:trichohyalin-like protein [Achlya hypogyna]